MPVAANVRIAPLAAESTAAAQSDGAAPAEFFGGIISGLAEASVESALEAPVPVPAQVAGTQPPPQVGEFEVVETVAQLLALASSRPAEAMVGHLEHGAEMPIAAQDPVPGKDVTVPQTIAAALPAISPLAQYRPITVTSDIESTVSSTDEPQAETSTVSDLPQIEPSQPNAIVAQAPADMPKPLAASAPTSAQEVGSADRANQASSGPAADQPPQLALSRTQAVEQLALSNLEAAVEALSAQAPAPRPGSPARRSGEIDSTFSPPELKLGAAMTLPSINPLAGVFESLRPADTGQIGTQPGPQPLGAGEMVIEHQLDMAHEGEWLDQLARDISRSTGSDGSPLRFRLNPENLGSLRVEISQDRNGAAVRLTTDTEAARAIIAEAQPRLVAEARAQGIRISEAHVDLGGQTASGDPGWQKGGFEEAPLRTARSLREHTECDANPTRGRSGRYD